MKKIILIAALIIAITSVGVLILWQNGSLNNLINKNDTSFAQAFLPQIKQIYYRQDILIPVSKFKTYKIQYSLAELTKDKLVTLAANKNLLPIGYEDIVLILPEDLEKNLQADKIALLTPDQVLPKYRTLQIDQQSFWQKNFQIQNYPLKKLIASYDATIITDEKPIVIFATGEIIPARAVDRLGFNKYNNFTYVYDFFKNDIASADIAIAQLENSLLGNPKPCSGCMAFIGDDQVANSLKEEGFDWVNTAGNHAGDAGQKAYGNTIKLFTDLGIQVTGTGKTEEEILKPAINEINGRRIGLISADDIANYYWNLSPNNTTYGTNYFSKSNNGALSVDTARVAKIATIKKDNNLDYLIVYMSWGIEYTNNSTKHQQELAHKLIDNGADLIIASHPHWVQSIEEYNGKMILYSMGNFIFDQTHTTETRQGYVTNLDFWKNELKNIEIIPQQSCGYHQTTNDLIPKYLNNEITLEEVYNTADKSGCVYWQPKKLKEDHPAYKQILDRIYQYTEL
ncbi:MAG: CapA family protein [bacterium]